MKKKMSKEKMNYLKNFSSYIALCHISLGMFSTEVFANQTIVAPNPTGPIVEGAVATGSGSVVMAAADASGQLPAPVTATGQVTPPVDATLATGATVAATASTSIDSSATATTDQQFAQAQIAAQNLKALIEQQQSSTASSTAGGVAVSGNTSPGAVTATGATDAAGIVGAPGSVISTGAVAGVPGSTPLVAGATDAAGSVLTTGVTGIASTIGGVVGGPGMVITAGGVSPATSVLGTTPMTISADGVTGVAGAPGMLLTQGGIVAGPGGLMPAPMPMTLTDSGSFSPQRGGTNSMSSYINTKVQDFMLEETIKGVLNAMEEMSDSPYNMRTIGSVVKALDNPARARQEILMRSLMINQPNIVNVAVDKLIGDYAPGNISEDQRNAVLSAARVAMEYGRQYGKLGALSFMTRDLSDMGSSDEKMVDSKGKPISKSEQDVGMSLTDVDGQTCMVDPQILGKLPAGCNIYTVNFYGQDGVNNFYKVNINGNMVAASNKSLKVPGTVKWSITYGCSQNTVAPITTPAAGVVTPGSPAPATPAVTNNTVTTTNVATVGGFSCDAQKGLLLPSGNGITNFSNNNGVLTVS